MAENEPDPRGVINGEQGPLAGWLETQIWRQSDLFADSFFTQPKEIEARVEDVKVEIVLAYNAMRHAYGGTLPRVESATVGDYFETLMRSPDDDPLKAPADRAKLVVIKDEFFDEQVHLREHITNALDAGYIRNCGLTYTALTHQILLAQMARPSDPSTGA